MGKSILNITRPVIAKIITEKNNILLFVSKQIPVTTWNNTKFVKMSNHASTEELKATQGVVQNENVTNENNQRQDYPWKRAKKVAMMISFSGKDYLGMQRNPPHPTIEEELLKALRSSGAIAPDWFDRPQQAYFQRASRTDKGVSAIKMIVSLRMALEDDSNGIAGSGTAKTIENIQKYLPDNPRTIQVNEIKRVTKNFNCKSACDARTYEYLLPTFTFQKVAKLPPPTVDSPDMEDSNRKDDITDAKLIYSGDEKRKQEIKNENWSIEDMETAFASHENYRITPELRTRINEVLKKFTGSHYYHNYTSGKLPLEPSALRYITAFEIGEPFLYSYKDASSENINAHKQLEFAVIKVKGQSFMLHQIRKMIGMTIAVVRGDADESVITESWNTDRIDVPRAPGLGLMLEEVHYEKYNHRFGKDGIHESLEWNSSKDEVKLFKENIVYDDILKTEAKNRSMLLWLRNLRIHSFEPRHFENVSSQHLDNVTRAAAPNSRQDKNGINIAEKQSNICDDLKDKSSETGNGLNSENSIISEETESTPKRAKLT